MTVIPLSERQPTLFVDLTTSPKMTAMFDMESVQYVTE
jgi:hypothetical protein